MNNYMNNNSNNNNNDNMLSILIHCKWMEMEMGMIIGIYLRRMK